MKLNKKHQVKINKPGERSLFEALSVLKTPAEAEHFFKDLCTPTEIQAMVDRWQVVNLVKLGKSYREINVETNISVTTIGRVARAVMLGEGGYNLIYNRLQKLRKSEK